MLETRDLTRRYGAITAVDSLNLVLPRGEIFGLLGPNGAGKTTTIKLITGLLRPTSGTVRVGGHDIQTEPREAKRLIGYVADEPCLYEKLTPREFLQFNGELYGVPREELPTRIDRLLALFDLADRANLLIESSSHGMKQKISVAGALVHSPSLLLLDEPTVGLDPRSARILKEVLKRLAARGTTVLLSTHILEIAERLCDRVGIIHRGRLVAVGTVDELRTRTGEDTLEEAFLEMTGAEGLDGVIEALGE